MKKFKFRLEKVLQFREQVKEEKMLELSKCNAELFEKEEQLKGLLDAEVANRSADNQSATAAELEMRNLYSARLRFEIENTQLEIIRAQDAVKEAQEIYVEASKEVETLAVLKEKKRAEYQEYIAKEEEKFLNELATQRARVLPLED